MAAGTAEDLYLLVEQLPQAERLRLVEKIALVDDVTEEERFISSMAAVVHKMKPGESRFDGQSIQELVKDIDRLVDAQMNEILLAPGFQELAAVWTAIANLVEGTNREADVRFALLDVGKNPAPDGPALRAFIAGHGLQEKRTSEGLVLLIGTTDAVFFYPLWSTLCSPDTPIDRRIDALRALLVHHDDDDETSALPAFIAGELALPSLDPAFRDALLDATEHVQFVDPTQRRGLAACLLDHARVLCRDPGASEGAMWAAIRRYATLIPETEEAVAPFLEFLDPAERWTTQQVALQSLANVFSLNPPAPGLRLAALRERVAALAWERLRDEGPTSSPRKALAVSAFCAAAALVVSDLDALAVRFAGLSAYWLPRHALQVLEPMETAWSASAEGSPALAVLRSANTRLRQASSGGA